MPPPAQRALTPFNEALQSLLSRITPVETEQVDLADADRRIIAQDVIADRPSPPVNVSAMDGYALRIQDAPALWQSGLPIDNLEAGIGEPIRTLSPGSAMRIFTGSPVPTGADAVIKREDLVETQSTISCTEPIDLPFGQHIRRKGANTDAGETIVRANTAITPAISAALAAFGAAKPTVYRRVRVAIVVTGNELTDAADSPTQTAIRDSNAPMLRNYLNQFPWTHIVSSEHAPDDPAQLRTLFRSALDTADCIISTGGVSMGDHDHVPEVAESLAGETIFHRLSLKPGKPVYAAAFPSGQVLIGLPGNPVSVMATARTIAFPALATLAGLPTPVLVADARLSPAVPDTNISNLTRFMLIRRAAADRIEFVPTQSSGDIVALSKSDGVARIDAGHTGAGPLDCFFWRIA